MAFDSPVQADDGHGGIVEGFADDDVATKVWAKFLYLRGGETVQAARLAGTQPIVVTVRSTSASRLIDPTWRMRDIRSGEIFNIRSGPVPTDDRLYLEFTVEGGVAT
nr:head-tail adaptor protein [Neorhizobium alkalisoli]